jgi:peptidoglycan/LPS O-acetylase OafA/YrhL
VTKQKYYSIEAARGVAAVLVVLLHAGTGMAPEQYSGHVGLGGLFNFGRYGVDLFFVISGYIICKSSGFLSGETVKIFPYLVRRIFRIFPAYYFILLISLIINQFQRGRVQVSPEWFARQLFFLDNPLFISAAWTLQFEFVFYAVVAIALVSRTAGMIVALFWGILMLHRAWFGGGGVSHDSLYEIVSNPYCIYFFIGAIGYYIEERYLISARLKAIGAGVAFVAIVAVAGVYIGADVHLPELLVMTATGVLFMLLIATGIFLEQRRILSFELVSYFGRISYSLYLCNILILGLGSALMVRIGIYHYLSETAIIVIGLILCICFADLMYRFVEIKFISCGRWLESFRESYLSRKGA